MVCLAAGEANPTYVMIEVESWQVKSTEAQILLQIPSTGSNQKFNSKKHILWQHFRSCAVVHQVPVPCFQGEGREDLVRGRLLALHVLTAPCDSGLLAIRPLSKLTLRGECDCKVNVIEAMHILFVPVPRFKRRSFCQENGDLKVEMKT